ncbi:MAG: hypothetical protein AB8F26_05905 [Phycisphaerales bacterium]
MTVVDRCICHDVPLTKVRERAAALRTFGMTDERELLRSITQELSCTTGCGMCKPYVILTLRTGKAAYDYRDPEVAAVLAERERALDHI